MQKLIVGLIALSAFLMDCGPDAPNDLAQDFYGRWEGSVVLTADDIVLTLPVSVGLSINKERGYLTGLCARPVGPGTLSGTGRDRTLEVYGEVDRWFYDPIHLRKR